MSNEHIHAELEVIMEHLQSAWIATGHYTAHDRYERTWPRDSTEYHLQAAECAGNRLYTQLAVLLPEPITVNEALSELESVALRMLAMAEHSRSERSE